MAIYNKHNIVEIVRLHNCPYWKIYENENKKSAGNYVATARIELENLGINQSCDDLMQTLSKLTPGRYLLVAYEKKGDTKKGVDTAIEIEAGARSEGISGTGGQATEFVVPGIGKVTPENFEDVLEKKFKKMQEEAAEKERVKKLEEENKKLKVELLESQGGINRGLMSIGAIAWEHYKNTPAGKQIFDMMAGFSKKTSAAAAGSSSTKEDQKTEYADFEEVGSTEAAEKRMSEALETLAKDNPEMIAQLEKMAKLKQEHPELYKSAVENLNSMV